VFLRVAFDTICFLVFFVLLFAQSGYTRRTSKLSGHIRCCLKCFRDSL
jgi:hypothetical protein